MGNVRLGFGLQNIAPLANKEISKLHLVDFVIIWGGAKILTKGIKYWSPTYQEICTKKPTCK
jgi:uncharacterized membrane protein YcaP (DUF421 family)